jgi:hypothetical protein
VSAALCDITQRRSSLEEHHRESSTGSKPWTCRDMDSKERKPRYPPAHAWVSTLKVRTDLAPCHVGLVVFLTPCSYPHNNDDLMLLALMH